jgi:hypothetical protein
LELDGCRDIPPDIQGQVMFEEKTRCAKQKEGSEEYMVKLIGFE